MTTLKPNDSSIETTGRVWTPILDQSLTGESSDHDFKIDGTTLALVPDVGGAITLTATNGANSSVFKLFAETSGGAGDGYLEMNCSSATADFFLAVSTAPQLSFDLADVDDVPDADEPIRVTLYGTPPPLVADATNPSSNVFRNFDGSTGFFNHRSAHTAGGWVNSGFEMPTNIGAMVSGDTAAPTWPRSWQFDTRRGGLAYGSPTSGDLSTPLTPLDVDQVYGHALRKGDNTIAQATSIITRIVVERLV